MLQNKNWQDYIKLKSFWISKERTKKEEIHRTREYSYKIHVLQEINIRRHKEFDSIKERGGN